MNQALNENGKASLPVGSLYHSALNFSFSSGNSHNHFLRVICLAGFAENLFFPVVGKNNNTKKNPTQHHFSGTALMSAQYSHKDCRCAFFFFMGALTVISKAFYLCLFVLESHSPVKNPPQLR